MEKKVLSSLVLSGAMMVMAPQAWAQTGGSAPGSGKSGSEPQVQKPTDPPMSGQQRGTSGELQSERSTGRAGAPGQMQSQRAAGQQRLSKDQVKQIQEALKDKGQNPGEADGIMGPKTQQALREFQKSQNLQATGRVDEKTASALGVDVSPGAGSSSSSGMGSSREPSSASDKASSSKGASGASSGLGSSPSGAGSRSGSASSTKGNNPDITEPKKGSTAGRQESTDANPK
jgi:hypothetical protein